MGVLYNDPNVTLDDICWYNMLAIEMYESLQKDEGLISTESVKQCNSDKELKTYSCYVELHRKRFNRSIDFGPRFQKLNLFYLKSIIAKTVKAILLE